MQYNGYYIQKTDYGVIIRTNLGKYIIEVETTDDAISYIKEILNNE